MRWIRMIYLNMSCSVRFPYIKLNGDVQQMSDTYSAKWFHKESSCDLICLNRNPLKISANASTAPVKCCTIIIEEQIVSYRAFA